jgi:tRNA(Ile)-lysidine synthase
VAQHHPDIARALGLCRASLEPALDVRPARLLVACSGGPDSVALLGLCNLLRKGLGLELVVGHVDHGLRPESGAEAEHVRSLARGLGLGFEHTRVELEPGPGLPARARRARRRALLEQAARAEASRVALGHTATDQLETMLMHLVRGSGVDGIAAMPPMDAPWVRPLLGLDREQTRDVATRLGLGFVDDPTNRDPSHFRARLRTEVLPLLRGENPRVDHAFVAASEQARDAEHALGVWAQRECAGRARAGHRWSLEDFDLLPRAVRTRVLRALCEQSGVGIEALKHQVIDAIDAAAVERALTLRPPRGGPGVEPKGWDLHPNRRLLLENDEIRVEASKRPNH